MNIKLDRINNHFIHIEKQQGELQKLLDYLTDWRNQLLTTGMETTILVDEHIRVANNLLECTQRRKMYLQSIIEKLTDINVLSSEILTDAMDILKQYQTVL